MSVVENSPAAVQGSAVAGAWSWISRHALALLIVLGATIRFATLGGQDYWLDEQITVNLVQQGPSELLRSVIATESNPSFYYLLAAGFERVLGSSEFAIRSLSALAGIATIPVMYAAAKTLGGRRAGLIAAALTATSPLLIWYSQEARNYELLLLISSVSFLCFVKALDDTGHRWLWSWALASALALATHYFSFFLIVPEFLFLLYRRQGSRIDTAIPFGATAIVGLALLPITATQRGRGDWIQAYDFGGRMLNLPEHFLVGYQVPWPALPTLAIVLIALVVGYALFAGGGKTRGALLPAAAAGFGGLAIVLLVVVAGEDYVLTRNLLELWPAFAAMLAVVLAVPEARQLGAGAAVALCILGLGLVIWTAFTPAAQRPAYSELAEVLEPLGDERLIVSQSSFSSPLIFALDATRPATDEELSTRELVVIEQRPTDSYAVGTCVWLPTCGGVDVEPPPRFEPPLGFTLASEGVTESFAYRIYDAPQEIAIERPTEYFTPRVFLQDPA